MLRVALGSVLSAGTSGLVRVWSVRQGDLITEHRLDVPALCACALESGRWAIGGADGSLTALSDGHYAIGRHESAGPCGVSALAAAERFFFQHLGACRRRTPRTLVLLMVPKDASRPRSF